MKNIIAIILLLTCLSTQAQNLHDHIPANSSMIISVNLEQLNSKSEGEDYMKYLENLLSNTPYSLYSRYGRYNRRKTELLPIKSVIQTPKVFSLNQSKPLYLFNYNVDMLSTSNLLFEVSDAAKFESELLKLQTPKKNEVELEGLEVEETRSYYDYDASDDDEHEFFFIQKDEAGKKLFICETQLISISGNVVMISQISNGSSYTMMDQRNADENTYLSKYAYESDYDYRKKPYMDSIYFVELAKYRNASDSMLLMELNDKEQTKSYYSLSNKYQNASDDIISRAKARYKQKQNEKLSLKFNEWATVMAPLYATQVGNLSKNRNFNTLMNDKHDAFIFTQLNNQFTHTFNLFGRRHYGMTMLHAEGKEDKQRSKFQEMFEGQTGAVTLDFEKGKVRVKQISNYTPVLEKDIKEVYSLKQNKKILKYIPGNQIMGYLSYSVNNRKLSEIMEPYYFEMIKALDRNDGNDISTAIEMFWAFIDKEMLYNTIGSQAILAVTGFTDVKFKYKTYDYDENFNRTMREEERLEKQPSVVLVTAVNNQENMKKIFDIFSKFSIVQKLKDNLLVIGGNREFKSQMYILFNSDALILTNNSDLVLNHPNGYSSSEQLSASDKKFILSHRIALKTYTENTLNNIRNTYFSHGGHEKWYEPLFNNMGDLTMYDVDYKSAEIVLSLKDSNSNSLKVLLQLMNKMGNGR